MKKYMSLKNLTDEEKKQRKRKQHAQAQKKYYQKHKDYYKNYQNKYIKLKIEKINNEIKDTIEELERVEQWLQSYSFKSYYPTLKNRIEKLQNLMKII